MDFYTTEICPVKKPRTNQAGQLHVGEIVRRIVESRGLQKKWIASQIGTTDTNFSAMLSRYSLTTDQLERLGKVLGVDFYAIISEEMKRLNAQYGVLEPEPPTTAEPESQYTIKDIMNRMAELETRFLETLAKQEKKK